MLGSTDMEQSSLYVLYCHLHKVSIMNIDKDINIWL